MAIAVCFVLGCRVNGEVVPNVVAPPGFTVGLFAGPQIAEDARAIAVHESGAVLVAGPGYLRLLRDLDGNGVADGAVEFAPAPEPDAVPSGLWTEPGFVYWVGGGGVWRYGDLDHDGIADGQPQHLLAMAPGEASAQCLVRGPDGWWYLSGGRGANWSGLRIEGLPPDGAREGGIIRISPAFDSGQWLAGGLATARRLAFHAWGELFVVDDGVDALAPMPWQTRAGIWHLARGARHGWGRQTSRPSYYLDQSAPVASLGQTRLTGLVAYRHLQFPARYRDGLFALDWAAGKVWFVPVRANGASYAGRPELFVDSPGAGAFTPIDAAVAFDGSLLVACGDRKTRGGIYRIQHVADGTALLLATNWVTAALTPLRAVLMAPQPLSAWSRAYWAGVAVQIGREAFESVAADAQAPALFRARAIEVLTEIFFGLSSAAAEQGARANDPLVRARTAWAIGRAPCEKCASILLELALDRDVAVRRVGLEAVLDQERQFDSGRLERIIAANLSYPERRPRQLAARLASRLPEQSWERRWAGIEELDRVGQLTMGLALLWRKPTANDRAAVLEPALRILKDESEPGLIGEALRLIILALDDWRNESKGYSGFTPEGTIHWSGEQQARVAGLAAGFMADQPPQVAMESARVLALLADGSSGSSTAVVHRLERELSPEAQIHYLAVLARLPGETDQNPLLAALLIRLGRSSEVLRGQPHWPVELIHLIGQLIQRVPALAGAMVNQPGFAVPANLDLVPLLAASEKEQAARLFLSAAKDRTGLPWTKELVELMGVLPANEVNPVLREQWRRVGLREKIARVLARTPAAADRDKLLWALSSEDWGLVRESLDALRTLPKLRSPAAWGAGARLLQRLLDAPEQLLLRAQVMEWLERETGHDFEIQEQAARPLRAVYWPVFEWIIRQHPAWKPQLGVAGDPPPWVRRVQAASQYTGDPVRGQVAFQQRRCAGCHHGAAGFGPDLGAVLRGASPLDILRAVFLPDDHIAAGYEAIQIRTRQGVELLGRAVWEGALGLIMNIGPNESIRVAWAGIAEAEASKKSLMPEDLLQAITPRELSDLQAFLRANAKH